MDTIQTPQRGGGSISEEWQKEIAIGKTNNRKIGTHRGIYLQKHEKNLSPRSP